MRAVSKKRMQLLTRVQLVNEQRDSNRKVGAKPELAAPYMDPHYPMFSVRGYRRTAIRAIADRPERCTAVAAGTTGTFAACLRCNYIWGAENTTEPGCLSRNPVPQPDPETRGHVKWFDWLIVGSVVVLVLVILGRMVLR